MRSKAASDPSIEATRSALIERRRTGNLSSVAPIWRRRTGRHFAAMTTTFPLRQDPVGQLVLDQRRHFPAGRFWKSSRSSKAAGCGLHRGSQDRSGARKRNAQRGAWYGLIMHWLEWEVYGLRMVL